MSILGKFYDAYQYYHEELTDLVKSGDMQSAARSIHTLKGVSGNIGAKLLNYLVKALEEEIKGEAAQDQMNTKIDQVSQELETVLIQMKELFAYELQYANNTCLLPLSNEQLLAMLHKLKHLLENYDSEAKALYDEIVSHMEKNNTADLVEMGSYISNFDFEEALTLCEKSIDEMMG